MNSKIPQWLLVLVWVLTLVYFAIASFPLLKYGGSSFESELHRFIGPAILTGFGIFLNLFEPLLSAIHGADVKTIVFFFSFLVAGVLLLVASLAKDKDVQEKLFQAGFCAAGFAVGLDVGGRLKQSGRRSRPRP